jgi:hypothetical protein
MSDCFWRQISRLFEVGGGVGIVFGETEGANFERLNGIDVSLLH